MEKYITGVQMRQNPFLGVKYHEAAARTRGELEHKDKTRQTDGNEEETFKGSVLGGIQWIPVNLPYITY